MNKAEEIYHRFIQYEWNDVSDSLKMSIIRAINEAMGINTNGKWRVISGIYKGHYFYGYVHSFGDTVKVIDCGTVGRSYPIEFCEKVETPCNHRWIRTTKNYKRIKKCYECGEVKEVEEKLPTNCPHCGELINYLNHKKHLYMQCVNDEKKL